MKKKIDKNLLEFMKLKYSIKLIPEEKGYFVEIPELDGCWSQGETLEEAMENIEEAKELWLETALKINKKIPLPFNEDKFSGKFVVRLPKSLHRKISENALKEGISLNQYIVYLLSESNQLKELDSKMNSLCKQVSLLSTSFEFVTSKITFNGEKENTFNDHTGNVMKVDSLPSGEFCENRGYYER